MTESLAGSWTGIYFYPEDHPDNADDLWPPTAFVAELIDRSGVITGWAGEPDMLHDARTEQPRSRGAAPVTP